MWDGNDDDDDSDEECSLRVRAAGRRSYLVWRSSLPVQSQHGFVGTPPQTCIHDFLLSCDLELGRCGAWNPVSGSQTSYGQRAVRLQET